MGASHVGSLRQRDIYFVTSRGRLKLRQWNDDAGAHSTELIGYERPDRDGSRISEYYRIQIPDAKTILRAFSLTLDVSATVEKERRLYIYGSTRIHLDTVVSLGWFMELETVLAENAPMNEMERAQAEYHHVVERLGLGAFPNVAGSYSNLMM